MNQQVYFPFYFPTKIILLDDDDLYLETLNRSLRLIGNVSVDSNSDPKIVQNIINDSVNSFDKIKETLIHSGFADHENASLDEKALTLANKSTQKYMTSSDLKKILSLLIIDYDMPAMTGLDFVQDIHNKNIKIILLTGVAEPDIVIDAFNQGKIHAFIRKDDERCLEKLIDATRRLQNEFFMDLHTSYEPWIPEDLKPFLKSEEFTNIFNGLLKKHNIQKYCFSSEPFGYTLFSHDKQYHLLLRNWAHVRFSIEQARENGKDTTYLEYINDVSIFPSEEIQDIYQGKDEFLKADLVFNQKQLSYFFVKTLK